MKRNNDTFFKIEGKNLRFLPRPGLWGLIVLILFGISLAANAYFWYAWKDCDSIEIIDNKTDTIYKTRTVEFDTIYPDKPDIITIDSASKNSASLYDKHLPLNDGVIEQLPAILPDTLRTYTGITNTDSVTIEYRITTTGFLKSIILNATYPDRTIRQMMSYEKVKKHAFYVNASADVIADMQNVKLGASYLQNQWMIRYEYGLLFNQHTVGIGYKIIAW